MVCDEGHIVCRSDFPHSPAKIIIPKKKHLDSNPKYTQLIRKIYHENAQRLLHKE